ncbi:hypothetical protein ACIGKL_05000 [Pseudomonas sp. NPDC077186]|uniref:hypothetical protein n=1 Tax=Pseudomonas sp. NPDC077186 TaxID=3364421 RepID=UPI0037CBFD07
MFEWFAGAVASANAAKDISQSLMTLRDGEMIRSRVFDLTQNLMDLQQQLMTAQMEQMQLVDKISKLEQQNAQLQKQADLDGRYELHQFETGAFCYRLKPELQNDQPEHFLCSKCFERGIRSTMHQSKGSYHATLGCPECKQVIDYEPRKPRPRIRTVSRRIADY